MMGAPEIIFLSFALFNLLYAAHKHGQPRDGKWNVWATLIAAAIEIGLLWWGGFFK